MKQTSFRLFLFAALIMFSGILTNVKAQSSSTEGREFWIALTKAKTTGSGGYTPYITVSAKKACKITLVNPNTNWQGIEKEIPAGLTTIESSEIPQTQWVNTSFNTSDFQVAQPLGLLLTSTENVSVNVASRMEFSFDATNVLPISALTGDYMIQDYPACDHEDKADQNSATFVVVATQNNTHIRIVPTYKTRNGNAAGSAFTATLNRGEVYHVITEDTKGSSFTGTRVTADQPIAVFAGDVNTDVPGEASARDLLYEQQMPTAFWGTEFVVTRTMDRDADRVRMTALNDGTEIYINGIKKAIINSGQTYEIELSEGNIDQSALNKMFTMYDELISGADAHYIKTSCPVATYLYIVSQKYKQKDATYDNGDPSMVWISPLEQKIKEITFGEFATDKTEDHYVNIITETSNVESMQLFEPTDPGKQNKLTPSDFQPVLGNPDYSYARIKIDHSNTSRPISKSFTIKGNKGFIAHVYGNGEKESYAYSVGSAAVQRSIQIDGIQLGNGDSAVICLGEPIEFATNFSTYTVDQITWDMGDGVTNTYYSDATYLYNYDAPGWYDIIVTYSLTNQCTNEVVANEALAVKLYVNIPDTINNNVFLCQGDYHNGEQYNTIGRFSDTVSYDCEYVAIENIIVGAPTDTIVYLQAFDSVFVQGDESNPSQYVYESAILERHYKNITGCDSTVEMNIEVLHCTEMEIEYSYDVCGGDTLVVYYTLLKGEMPRKGLFYTGKGGTKTVLIRDDEPSSGRLLVLGLEPGIYENAYIHLTDPVCNRQYRLDVPVVTHFPSSIIAQKWNNVLAVYNETKNGGYKFTAFQWYKNDEPIEGATGSYYHAGSDQTLEFGAYYYVMLTTTDGLTLASCPVIAYDKYATPEANIRVTPTVVNRGEKINIEADLTARATMFSATGVKETSAPVNNTAEIEAPQKSGVYVLQVQLEDGTTQSFRVLVK